MKIAFKIHGECEGIEGEDEEVFVGRRDHFALCIRTANFWPREISFGCRFLSAAPALRCVFEPKSGGIFPGCNAERADEV